MEVEKFHVGDMFHCNLMYEFAICRLYNHNNELKEMLHWQGWSKVALFLQ